MVAGERCWESSGHAGDKRALLLRQTAVKARDAETSPGHSLLENVEAPGEGAFPGVKVVQRQGAAVQRSCYVW